MRTLLCWVSLAAVPCAAVAEGIQEGPLRVGFGACDVTPALSADRPVWLAGYTPGRQATGIHDPLYARCLVAHHAKNKLALVSVDLIGLQYPAVRQIRERVPGYAFVMVASTHNHEGPDVVGIWGKSFFHRGVDDRYVATVVDRIAEMIRRADRQTVPAEVTYGTASDESLLHDSRRPYVKDGTLKALRFREAGGGRTLGILLQWSCHPETLGEGNTQITADFPAATVAAVSQRQGCPVVYFAGALGGLMAPPRERIRDPQGMLLGSGDFEFARHYGLAVADLAERAMERGEPISLTPFRVSAKPIVVPVENVWYRAARVAGILRREGRVWTGDFEQLGEPVGLQTAAGPHGVETEVGYLQLGQLHVACIPGEIYPELVYGKVEDPPDPGADFPEAPREPSVVDTLPGDRWLLFGLANDEIGYIIPKRQWDNRPPFAYGRSTPQYGEINSCGPQTAPIIMEALVRRVREVHQAGGGSR